MDKHTPTAAQSSYILVCVEKPKNAFEGDNWTDWLAFLKEIQADAGIVKKSRNPTENFWLFETKSALRQLCHLVSIADKHRLKYVVLLTQDEPVICE
jgi:hypothetical protein